MVDEIRARTDRAGIPHQVRDDALRMMFTCAHPALDRASQLALTLRLISGLTVAEIARALLATLPPIPRACVSAHDTPTIYLPLRTLGALRVRHFCGYSQSTR